MKKNVVLSLLAVSLITFPVAAENFTQKVTSVVSNKYVVAVVVIAGAAAAFPKLYKKITGKNFSWKCNIGFKIQ